MANKIQFDVGMNNNEFMRNSRDIANAISSLKNTVAQAGKSMNSSAAGYGQAMRQSIQASREFENSVSNIKSRMDELRTSTSSIKAAADEFRNLQTQVESAQRGIDRLYEKQQELMDMGQGGPSTAWNENQAEIARVTAELEKQKQAYYDYAAAVEYAEKRLSTGKDEFGHMLTDEEKNTYDQEANFNVELANQAVERIEAAEAALESLKQTEAELEANGENGPSQQFVELTNEIDQAILRLTDMQSKLDEMRGLNYENADQSDTYQDQVQELQQLEAELDNARQIKEEALKPPYMQSWEQMITLSGMISEGFGRIQNAASGALYAITHPIQAIDRALGTVIAKTAQAAASFARMAGNAAVSFLRKLASEAQNAAIQLAKLAGNAIHGAFQKLAQGAQAAGRGLLGLVRNNKAADGSFKRGFMTIMKYAFGVRSMYFLFRRLRTAITSAFTEMAKSSPEVRSAISGLQAALNGLKGSLASAFAPIFTAVAPALTYLINMLTAAMNAVGAFFAALTGKSSYKKAVGSAKSAASGAGKAAKSAKKDIKDLKRELLGFDELNILNGDKDNSGDGGGGGGGGGAGSGMSFVDEQIPGGIKDFVDKLKEMWNNKEFVKIGKMIADWVNGAFAKAKELITWENVSEKIQGFVDAVAGIMEGLLTYIDWKNIGDTIAEAVRTIANTIDTFMTKLPLFVLAGAALAKTVNGFFGNKQMWEDIGKTITDSVRAFLAFGQAFVDGFDAAEAGRGIRTAILKVRSELPSIAEEFWKLVKTAFAKAGSFINAIFGGADEEEQDVSRFMRPKPTTITPKITVEDSIWDTVAETLTNGFNTVIEKLTTFIEEHPIQGAVSALANWLIKVKNGVSWENLGKFIGASFQAALGGIGAAIEAFANDAQTTGDHLGDALNTAIGKVDWDSGAPESVSGIITNLFKGAIGLVTGFFEKFNVAEFVKSLGSALKGVPWASIAQSIWDLITEQLAKLGDVLTVIFGGGEAKDAVDAVEKMWDRHDGTGAAGESFNAGELFTNISTTVLNAIKAAFANIPWDEWGGRIHTFLVDDIDWSAIFESILGLFIEALTGIQDLIFAAIFGKDFKNNKVFQTLFPAQSLAYTLEDALKQPDVQAAVDGVVSDAVEKYSIDPEKDYEQVDTGSVIGDLVTYFVKGVQEKIPEPEDSYDENGQPIADSLIAVAKMLQDMGQPADAIVAQLASTEEEQALLREALESSTEATNENTAAVDGNTEDGGGSSEVSGDVDVNVSVNGESGTSVDAGENVIDGIITGAENKQGELDETMANAAESMNTTFEENEGIASPSKVFEEYGNMIVAGLIEGLKTLPDQLQTIWDALPEWAQTMFANLGKTIGVDINANANGNGGGGGGASDTDTKKNTKASKKETKETKKNTKELKKNTEKRAEVDVNYEGAGFDMGEDGKPKLNVGVDFIPNDDDASEEDKNGGLLGWLQKLLEADTLEAKIALIRDGWESFKQFLSQYGVDENTPIGTLIDLIRNNFDDFMSWLGIDPKSPIGQLIKLILDNAKNILDFLGIDPNTPLKTVIALILNKFDSLLDFLGIDENNPIRVFLNLLKNMFDPDAEDVLNADGKEVTIWALLKKLLTSKTPEELWNTILEILAKLTGKDPAGFKSIGDIFGAIFEVVAKLTGKDSSSKTVGGIFGTILEIVAKLIGKDSGSKTLGGIFDTILSVLAKLIGKDSNSQTVGDVFGTIVTFIANLTSAGSNWKEKGGISKWLGGKVSLIANLVQKGSNWKEKGGIAAWLGGTVSLIANLVKTGSNWQKAGGITKWLNGAASIIANLTKGWKGTATKSLNLEGLGILIDVGLNALWLALGLLVFLGLNKLPSITIQVNLKANWKGTVISALGIGNLSTSIACNISAGWSGTVQKALGINNLSTSITVKLVKGSPNKISLTKGSDSWSLQLNELGGIITNGGILRRFGRGGVISGGMARYLGSVPHYAGGTTRAHGTVFVAGEAGPEILGHLNGRTEILNKSQIAQAIYSAVVSGMGAAVNALGKYIANHMSNCTNAIVQTIGASGSYYSDDTAFEFYMPSVASGGIMPYDVSMQIARSTQELQNTLDANNEDLIQAMVSALGNAAQSIIQAMQVQASRGNMAGQGITSRQVVDDINRAGQMYGQSPIRGV